MITAYKYKLRPNSWLANQFDEWLNLLRMQYNYRLVERFNSSESTRCPVNSCSLVSCCIAPLLEQPDDYWQKRDLLNTKKLFPEYKEIYSQVWQNCVERVKKAFDRYIKADKTGHSGKPKVKGKGRYHSFTYSQMKQDCIKGNRITLPKISDVKMILHRPIPDGFKIPNAQIVKAGAGYYVTLTLQKEATVPTISPDVNVERAVGIDMGVKDFRLTSNADTLTIPQFASQAQKHKKLRNKSVSGKNKGSNPRRKAVKRLAKHYQKIARQRKDFHDKTASQLLDKYDVIGFEDLNVKGWAKNCIVISGQI